MTKDKLVAEMDKAAETIGYVNAWVQPIRGRVMMQSTGIQTPVGIKVKGPGCRRHRGDLAADRAAAARAAGHEVGHRRADLRGLLRRRRATTSSAWRSTASPSTRRWRRCATRIGGDNIVGVKQADNTVVPLSVQYSPEYIDTLDKVKNTPVVTADGRSVPLGDIADVVGAEDARDDPQRQRQPGRLHLRRPAERDRPRLRRSRAGVSREEPDAADRLLRRVDRALSVRGRGARADAAHRAADAG